MPNDLLTYGLIGLVLILVIFTFRNSRKRKRDADEMQSRLVPGAEVMTQHGIFGTLVAIDDDKNEAIIETTPGTQLRVHRQTLAKVVDPTPEDNEDVVREPSKDELTDKKPAAKAPAKATTKSTEAAAPQFGELSEAEKPKRAPRKKPTE